MAADFHVLQTSAPPDNETDRKLTVLSMDGALHITRGDRFHARVAAAQRPQKLIRKWPPTFTSSRRLRHRTMRLIRK